ncbi:MAG: hypothetical protein RIF33_10610 [Cyclobacteriaceae bacterium]
MMNFKIVRSVFVFVMCCLLATATLAQEESTAHKTYHFNGSVSLTNNGFSFIPAFSLGKPATIIDLSIGGKRFSFDPQFRFDLDGFRPWSFGFIWRYKVIDKKRFTTKIGAFFPGLAYKEESVITNGVASEKITVQRFFIPELITNYKLSKKVSVGTYYIYGRGLEEVDQSKNTHFLSLQWSFDQLNLSKKVFLKFNPQFAYLNIDGVDGFFLASTTTIALRGVPISISSIVNKAINSDIGSKDFDWNISLVYTFKNSFSKG